MRVMTMLGTRPEIIRLSRIIPLLDGILEDDHILVDTVQNYDKNLRDIFYEELGSRVPKICLDIQGTFGEQLGIMAPKLESVIKAEKPDRFLVLGDTNSSLGAIVAKRMGVPVFHMEAGNRCHDPESPEEVNRKIIDAVSDVHMPYTERSRDNLIAEGKPLYRIFVTGNPIGEVIHYYLNIFRQNVGKMEHPLGEKSFMLCTLHRQENMPGIDHIISCLTFLARDLNMPIILPAHPRLRRALKNATINEKRIKIAEPMGFRDFLLHQYWADCIISDSGTVQEEAHILHKPVVTLRRSTERPETLEAGSNIICNPFLCKHNYVRCVERAMASKLYSNISEYSKINVADTVVNILLSNHINL